MNLANFDYLELGEYNDLYKSIVYSVFYTHRNFYNKMFSDEIFGYRNYNMEAILNLMYFNHYLYTIFQKITELEINDVDNIKLILEQMDWDCVVKTLKCKGINIGKYYNVILNLE